MDLAFALAEAFKGLEDGISHDAQCVVKHVRDQPRQQWALQVETRVGVHLNQIGSEFIVKHEIEAQNLQRKEYLSVDLLRTC